MRGWKQCEGLSLRLSTIPRRASRPRTLRETANSGTRFEMVWMAMRTKSNAWPMVSDNSKERKG